MGRAEELTKLKVAQLKILAKRAGIINYRTLRKGELVDAIIEAEKEEKKTSSVTQTKPPKGGTISAEEKEKMDLAERITRIYSLSELRQLARQSDLIRDKLEETADLIDYSEAYTRTGGKDVEAKRQYCPLRTEPDCPAGSMSKCVWNPDGFRWVCTVPTKPILQRLPSPKREAFLSFKKPTT